MPAPIAEVDLDIECPRKKAEGAQNGLSFRAPDVSSGSCFALLKGMAGTTGLEPAASAVTGCLDLENQELTGNPWVRLAKTWSG